MNDIIIPVKAGEINEELRYCLRSIAENLPHRNIIIAGYKPSWITNVTHVDVQPNGEANKYRRVSRNILAGAALEEASDWFTLFNDDMFVMSRMEEIPMVHRGHMIDMVLSDKAPQQKASMMMTYNALIHAGIKQPLNYEVHAPMTINKHALLDLLPILETMKLSDAAIQFRSFYGNMHHVGGAEIEDVKQASMHTFKYHVDFPIVSTTNESFAHGRAGEEIKEAFPRKCKYEL